MRTCCGTVNYWHVKITEPVDDLVYCGTGLTMHYIELLKTHLCTCTTGVSNSFHGGLRVCRFLIFLSIKA